MLEFLRQPWPWYVAGPLIGNKALGISSSLRHMCAACLPAGIPFLRYNWRAESWNLSFVLGITIGGFGLPGAGPPGSGGYFGRHRARPKAVSGLVCV